MLRNMNVLLAFATLLPAVTAWSHAPALISVFVDSSHVNASDVQCLPCATISAAIDAAVQIALAVPGNQGLPAVSVLASTHHAEPRAGQTSQTTGFSEAGMAVFASEHSSFMRAQVRCIEHELFSFLFDVQQLLLRAQLLETTPHRPCATRARLPLPCDANGAPRCEDLYTALSSSPLHISNDYGETVSSFLADLMFWLSAAGAAAERRLFGTPAPGSCAMQCHTVGSNAALQYPLFNVVGSSAQAVPERSPLQLLQLAGAPVSPAFNATCIDSGLSALAVNISALLQDSECDPVSLQCSGPGAMARVLSPLWSSASPDWTIQLAANSMGAANLPLPPQPLRNTVQHFPVGMQPLLSDFSQGLCEGVLDSTAAWVLGTSTVLPAASAAVQQDVAHTMAPKSGARLTGAYGGTGNPPTEQQQSESQGYLQLVGWRFEDCNVGKPDFQAAFPASWQLLSNKSTSLLRGGVVSVGTRGTACIAFSQFSGATSDGSGILVSQNGGTLALNSIEFSETTAVGSGSGLLSAWGNSTVVGSSVVATGHTGSSGAHTLSASLGSLLLLSNCTVQNAQVDGHSGGALSCSKHSSCAWNGGSIEDTSSSQSGGAIAADTSTTLALVGLEFSNTSAAHSASLARFAAWADLASAALSSPNLTLLLTSVSGTPHGGAVAIGLQGLAADQNCAVLIEDCVFSSSFAPVGGSVSVQGERSVLSIFNTSMRGSASSMSIPQGSPEAAQLNSALLGFSLYPSLAGCVFLGGKHSRLASQASSFVDCTAQLAGGAFVVAHSSELFLGEKSMVLSAKAGVMGGGAILGHGKDSQVIMVGARVEKSQVMESPTASIIKLFPVFSFPDPSLGTVPIGGAVCLVSSYLFAIGSAFHDSFAAAGGASLAATRGAAITLMDTTVSASRFKGINAHGGAVLVANSTLQLLGHSVIHDSAPTGGRMSGQGGVIAAGVALYNLLDIEDAIPVESPTMLALPVCPCSFGGASWATQRSVLSSPLHTYEHGACEIYINCFVDR